MGPNPPIILKLKRNLNWNTSVYKHDLRNLLKVTNQEKWISKILQHYFQSLIISKPIFHHYAEGLSIIIYCYAKTAPRRQKNFSRKINRVHNLWKLNSMGSDVFYSEGINKNGIEKRIIPWEINRLKKLEKILTFLYQKEVRIQLIKLKNPILNGSVLAQYLSVNSTRHSVSALWRKILKNFRLANFKYYNTPITFNWNNLIVNGYSFLFDEFSSYITGIKIKTSGRFTRRKGASRTKVKNYSIGSFQFNSASSLIDYGFVERKGKNGSQSIKVFISSKITYHT
jgi:hypothetical protein